MIDTHCHPQMAQYDGDRDEVIRRALDSGVQMICIGVDLESSRRAISLAEQYEGLWASVGLHPNDNLEEVYDQSVYAELAKHPKVVAIGEVGLDYYRTKELVQQKFQKERFAQQISLAQEIDKPLIIHCRDSLGQKGGGESAHRDMVGMLPRYKGVIHSFTGTKEQALKYVDLGYHIGVNGIITFTHQYDEAIAAVPLERILLETDSPYLAPVPYRGKRNEPSYLIEVAKRVAQIKGIAVEEAMHKTMDNAYKFINLYTP